MMHIIIGLITAIGGVVWALYRLQNSGLDLNSFNPFYWARRRKWEKQLGTKPLHCLDKPIDAAAVLLISTAKIEGEITREQKAEIINLFVNEFNLDKNKAVELYSSSSYLLQDPINAVAEVKNILSPCKNMFNPEQTESLITMLKKIASLENEISNEQLNLIGAVEKELRIKKADSGNWQ